VYTFESLRNRSLYPFWRVSIGQVLILSILLFVLSHVLNYWELRNVGLRERKFWKTKEIEWGEVTRVGSLGFSNKFVKISYGHNPENSSYILAEPSNLNGFITALRQFVPQAEFDISSNSTSTCKARNQTSGDGNDLR
jgi:hypothetical protein